MQLNQAHTVKMGKRRVPSLPYQACYGVEQEVRSLSFRHEPVGKLKAARLLSAGRNDENWHLGPLLLHLAGDFRSGLGAEKMVGDHQVDMILLEELESQFAGGSRQNGISRTAQHELSHSQGEVVIVDAQDNRG